MTPSLPVDWLALFPARDFRHPMATRRGDLATYFPPSKITAEVLSERSRWLDEAPNVYAFADEANHDAFLEALTTINERCSAAVQTCSLNLLDAVVACGKCCDADWVVLRANEIGVHVLRGGVVCFPSGWALREKLNHSLEHIHDPVPGLNAALQPRIDSFLNLLKSGDVFERSNWGLAPDTELNRHPSRKLPPFLPTANLNETWIRLEQQLLYRLPQTGALLFAIRVSVHSLYQVAAIPGVAARIAHALRTMPEPVAVYKGVAAVRADLIHQLEDHSS